MKHSPGDWPNSTRASPSGSSYLRDQQAVSRTPGANLFEVGLACSASRAIEDSLAILRQRREQVAHDLACQAA